MYKADLTGTYTVLLYQKEGAERLGSYIKLFNFNSIIVPEEASEDMLMTKIAALDWDIAVLDWVGSGPGSLEPLKYLREVAPAGPCIWLCEGQVSPRLEYSLRLQAFKAGVDDYITRPFNMDELIWRMRALLRRSGGLRQICPNYEIGGLYAFDTLNRTLLVEGQTVAQLSYLENKLLGLLCAYKNTYVPKALVIQVLWEGKNEVPNQATRTMDVYITHLRKYLYMDPKISIRVTKGQGLGLFISA